MASKYVTWFSGMPSSGNKKRKLRKSAPRRPGKMRTFESLESRSMLAVTATFAAMTGTLTVFGDSADNTIAVSRNAGGTLLVNDGAVTINGGTPTVANTALIRAFGLSGHDTISFDQANGA